MVQILGLAAGDGSLGSLSVLDSSMCVGQRWIVMEVALLEDYQRLDLTKAVSDWEGMTWVRMLRLSTVCCNVCEK